MVFNKFAILFVLKCFAVSSSLCRRCSNETSHLRGLFAPVFTTVDADGNLALDVIPEYAQFLVDYVTPGVLVASNLGEGATLTMSEEKQLIAAWMDAAKPRNLEVMVQIGGRPLADILELVQYAEAAGVNAIVVAPNLNYKPTTVKELVYYIECIARAASNTALLYFDNPQVTGVTVDMVEFTIEATKRIPTYVGLKAESFGAALRVKPILKPYQRIIMADSLYLAAGIFMDFDGFIVAESNLLPRRVVDIVDAGKRCNCEETRMLNEELLDITNAITSLGGNVPTFKAAMPLVTGINVGPVRAPEINLDSKQKLKLKQKLEGKGVEMVNREEEYSFRRN